jgi:hypothetical protein
MAVKISYNTLDKILSDSTTRYVWNFMDMDTRLDVLYELNECLKKNSVTRINRYEIDRVAANIIEQVLDEKDSEDERLYAVREFYNDFYGN